MNIPPADSGDAIERRIGRQVRLLLGLPASLTDGELAWADLFDHGLTSKSALVLVAWLHDEFEVEVPPRALWGDPYVAALAALVGTHR